MEPEILLTGALCFAVGISLGLFGGGGSVLTVPIFIYAAHYSANEAIALSLVTVGAASLLASIRYLMLGLVNGRLVLIFFTAGSITSFWGSHLTGYFSERALLTLFGSFMTVIAIILYLKAGSMDRDDQDVRCRPSLPISLALGAVIGFLTGFLGVGGGFLIVPAIALLMRCSLRTAIGTSLVIITLNSASAFWGHMTLQPISLMPAAFFVFLAALGTFAGSRLGVRLKSSFLQRGFAGLIFLLGLFLILTHLA